MAADDADPRVTGVTRRRLCRLSSRCKERAVWDFRKGLMKSPSAAESAIPSDWAARPANAALGQRRPAAFSFCSAVNEILRDGNPMHYSSIFLIARVAAAMRRF